MDVDSAGLEHQRLATPRRAVGRLTVDLDGADRRWDLLDVPDELGERRSNLPGGRATLDLDLGDLAVGIEALAGEVQASGSPVDLGLVHPRFGELGALPQTQDQHALRGWIQRAGVAALAQADDLANAIEGFSRRDAPRLVEVQCPVDRSA